MAARSMRLSARCERLCFDDVPAVYEEQGTFNQKNVKGLQIKMHSKYLQGMLTPSPRGLTVPPEGQPIELSLVENDHDGPPIRVVAWQPVAAQVVERLQHIDLITTAVKITGGVIQENKFKKEELGDWQLILRADYIIEPIQTSTAAMHITDSDLADAVQQSNTAQERIHVLLADLNQELQLLQQAEQRMAAIAENALAHHDAVDPQQVMAALQEALASPGTKRARTDDTKAQ